MEHKKNFMCLRFYFILFFHFDIADELPSCWQTTSMPFLPFFREKELYYDNPILISHLN